jgi:hypothetical protein
LSPSAAPPRSATAQLSGSVKQGESIVLMVKVWTLLVVPVAAVEVVVMMAVVLGGGGSG